MSLVPSIRGTLGSLLMAQPVNQFMNATVIVWANQQTGNYYCEDSWGYGKGRGTFMKQGEALTDGYQPELAQYCKVVNFRSPRGK